MKKIGCFAHTIDPLFFNHSHIASLVIFIPKGNKKLLSYFKGFQTILFSYSLNGNIEEQSDTDLVKTSGFKKAAQDADITHFIVSHRSSKSLFLNLKKLNITPLGNDYTWASKLEDKIYFDSLLSKLKVKKPRTLSLSEVKVLATKKPSKKIVIQDSESFGSFGTKIVSSSESITLLAKKYTCQKTLIREFHEGHVFGITMLVGKHTYALSSLRQQCYFETNLTFAGVQWIASKNLALKLRTTIEKTFKQLGRYCIDKKYHGVLNFDFIVDAKQNVFVIECNPRLSSATPHLLSYPELIHGIDVGTFIISHKALLPQRGTIPASTFQGALFDLMALSSKLPELSGVSQKNTFFIHKVAKPKYKDGEFLGMVLSKTALFSPQGNLLSKTKKLYKEITGISL